MRPSRRSSLLVVVLVFMLVFAAACYAQASDDNAVAHSAIANGQASLSSNIGPVNVQSGYPGMLTIGSNVVLDADTGAVVSGLSGNAGLSSKSVPIGGGNDDNFAAP